MTYDDFLDGLDGVKRHSPTQADARCPVPAHDDRTASLSVGCGDDRVLVHCHANTACTLDEICRSWGCEPRDLFFNVVPISGTGPQPLRIPPVRRVRIHSTGLKPRAKGRSSMPPPAVVDHWHSRIGEVAERLYELKGWTLQTLSRCQVGFDGERVVFPVYDTEDRLVALVRYRPGHQPKTYAVGERELWPAPETIEAEHLWLVEGEPDRVSAVEIGLDAVAVPGVGCWKQDWPERFAGKRVTVCFDCDSEGREAARKRVESLGWAGVEARAVDLASQYVDGYDLGDAVATAVREGRVRDLGVYLIGLENLAWAGAAA
jgi:hypothetical protein